jgi:hypothetical protein
MSDEERGIDEVEEATPVEETVAPEADELVAQEAPLAPPIEPAELEPPRKQTGLIVVVASMVLLMILAVFAGPPLYDAVNRALSGKPSVATETVSPAKARLTAAIEFVKASVNNDLMAAKRYLTDEAQAAATDAEWLAAATRFTTNGVVFADPAWSGDTTAVLTFSAPNPMTGVEDTGTLTLGTAGAEPPVVTVLFEAGGQSDMTSLSMLLAGSTWRVVSETGSSGAPRAYDAGFVKSVVATATIEETAP